MGLRHIVTALVGAELPGGITIKKSKLNPNGGLVERSVSVHVSNVNPVASEKSEK